SGACWIGAFGLQKTNLDWPESYYLPPGVSREICLKERFRTAADFARARLRPPVVFVKLLAMQTALETHFGDRLAAAVRRLKNPVVVGLDPRSEQLPPGVGDAGAPGDFSALAAAFERFCCGVIDVVAPLVPAVKPQGACWSSWTANAMTSARRQRLMPTAS